MSLLEFVLRAFVFASALSFRAGAGGGFSLARCLPEYSQLCGLLSNEEIPWRLSKFPFGIDRERKRRLNTLRD